MLSYQDFLFLFVSLIGAAFIIWKVSPYLWGERKNVSLLTHVKNTYEEQKNEKQFQRSLNTSAENAKKIRLVNTACLCIIVFSAVYFKTYFSEIVDSAFLYVLIGMLINAHLQIIPQARFKGLRLPSRLEICIFHAWLFPSHLVYAIRKWRS